MVCAGYLNYLHSPDKDCIDAIKDFLSTKGIVVHDLPDEEMIDIIYSKEIAGFQAFYGNPVLLQALKEKA